MSDPVVALRHDQDALRRDCAENYGDHTRRMRDMQRQIDDLSVVTFLCVCGIVVLLLFVLALAGQVVW